MSKRYIKRVLIPTDDPGYVPDLAKSYLKLGYDPVVGSMNFHLCEGTYDIVHFLWPEELSSPNPPGEKGLKDIRKKLEWWRQRSQLILCVQNFYPHGYEYNAAFKKLYNLFYSACSGIAHHSRASLELVCKEFPVAATKPNIVTTPPNYTRLLRGGFDRHALRCDFGLSEDSFVILVFGAIRKWEEACLVRKAYSKTRTPGKRLLLACRFGARRGSRFSKLIQLALWRGWIRMYRLPHSNGFIPDDDVYKYLEAADAVIIPRINDLNSGMVWLGMTFGKMIIAPEHGSYPDDLAGTENLLYKSGDPQSLASALEKASLSDRERIGSKNHEIATKKWGTDNIARDCINLAQHGANGV